MISNFIGVEGTFANSQRNQYSTVVVVVLLKVGQTRELLSGRSCCHLVLTKGPSESGVNLIYINIYIHIIL